jgi:2-haloacid dehalogenase
MGFNRREFLIAFTGLASAASRGGIRAVAFDAFPILDPRPVFALAAELFPEKGSELATVWRSRQFEYTWLRTVAGRYTDFWQVTEDALRFAAKAVQVELTAAAREKLMGAYLELRCWPDVPAALRALKDAGLRIAFLSNMTAQMLEAGIRNSQLDGMFEHVLSTDRVKAFKPDPRAYQMGVRAFGFKREQILFAAFAGWDAAGSKQFGYPTFWVNRQNQPAEELGVAADATGGNLSDMAAYAVTRVRQAVLLGHTTGSKTL